MMQSQQEWDIVQASQSSRQGLTHIQRPHLGRSLPLGSAWQQCLPGFFS
jgi:hypothetical protein